MQLFISRSMLCSSLYFHLYIYRVNVHHIGHGSQRKDWLEKLLILLSEMATVQLTVPGFILTKMR